MEDFSSIFLTLIPVAIFIALGVLKERQKKQKNEDRSRMTEALVSLSRESPAPSREDVFDAHSLLPDEDEPPPRPRMPKPPAPRLPREEPAPPFQAAPLAVSPLEAAPAPGPRGLGRLDRLPPLKRAVAFSELLGPPRSLSDLSR